MDPEPGPTGAPAGAGSARADVGWTGPDDPDQVAEITELLGRAPRGGFRVVLRSPDGAAVVIRNHPLLDDGTPMPTLYWLVDRDLNRRIGRLEADGGVREAEAAVDADDLRSAHERYRAARDAALPAGWTGPRPFGGVGGTRRGVKCLHTHYAWYLVGGDDPVGRWVYDRLDDPPGATAPAADHARPQTAAREPGDTP